LNPYKYYRGGGRGEEEQGRIEDNLVGFM